VLAQLVQDLPGHAGAPVEGGDHHRELERGVLKARPDHLDGACHLRGAVEGQVGEWHRQHDLARGEQHVQRDGSEGGLRVEDDEVVVADPLQGRAQAQVLFAAAVRDLLGEECQRLVRDDEVEAGMTRANDRHGLARLFPEHRIEQQVERRATLRADVDTEHLAELPLRVEVHQQHAVAFHPREVVPEAGRQRGLAAAALLVDEGDPTRNWSLSPDRRNAIRRVL
jgi:hypothetical protein